MSKQRQPKRVALVREPKHDATFFLDGTYFKVSQWAWSREPRRALAGWKKLLLSTLCGVVLFGLAVHRTATEWLLLLSFAPAAGVYPVLWFRRWQEWEHYRTKVKPLALALSPVLDQPAQDARSWLDVPQDYATRQDAEVVIDVPDDFTGADRDMEDITRAVAAKLSFPNPQAAQKLGGRAPCLIYRHAIPPPDGVSLPDIRSRIVAAKPSVVVLGQAAGNGPVDLDLDDEDPHAGVSMSTGLGKTEISKNMAAQQLYHGAIVLILDYKLVSHMWADRLPNVSYARTPAEIHQALMWLGWDECDADGNVIKPSELTRRKNVILAATRNREPVNLTRLFIIAEERNATTRILKRHWRRIGGKGTSPALEALDEAGETGRELCVNVDHVAQRLSAKASGSDGSRDALENIGAIITKDPSEQTWKLLAGGHAQPPKSGHPGRYQLIRRQGVTEYQGVLYDKNKLRSNAIARELAMSGTIGQVPHDMPFVYRGPLLVPAGIGHGDLARQEGSEQPVVLGPEAGVLTAGEGPARAVTLAEAVTAGVFVSIAAARKAAQRRGWEAVGGTKAGGFQYRVEDLYEYKLDQEKR